MTDRESCPIRAYCDTQRETLRGLGDILGVVQANSYDAFEQSQGGIPEATRFYGHLAGEASMASLSMPNFVAQVTPGEHCADCSLIELANQMAPAEPPHPQPPAQ